ncbi:MAG: ATP-binding protein [Melioribacteraceae bacterium]|jgi:AAA+ ATPase superfamily predicted ATPase|nr:ATP-binding protein [Melioribacteraceae bacterium]
MNPFKYGKIVTGEHFYNRIDELKRILDTLEGGNNLVLYAPRRYGKTSLVKRAFEELEKKGFTTVYIDFMSIYSREVFIKNFSNAIVEKKSSSIEKTVKKVATLIRGIVPSVSFDNVGNPQFSFSWIEGNDKEATLEDVINLPEKFAASNNKWIIAFDEFQEITKLNGESFEKLLRSLVQNHKNVSYIFLGSRTHLLKDMFSNKNRAFYNSAMLMNIGAISINDSTEYLIRRFALDKIEISNEIAEYLIKMVDSIPYYIQFIAAEVWQQVINNNSSVKKSHINEAIKTVIELKADYFWELTLKQTNYRKKVLFALASSVTELFSRDTEKSYNIGPSSTTQKAIASFIDEGIIEQFGNSYEFSDPFFKMFLKANL